jgi:hypothetical protein
LAWERLGLARRIDNDTRGNAKDDNFTVKGNKAVNTTDISTAEFMRICLAENDRRFAGYDHRLCRPMTMPNLVQYCTVLHACTQAARFLTQNLLGVLQCRSSWVGGGRPEIAARNPQKS